MRAPLTEGYSIVAGFRTGSDRASPQTAIGADALPNAWFMLDPEPKLVFDARGLVVGTNVAGREVIDAGLITVTGGQELRLGSVESDARLQGAIRHFIESGGTTLRLVLRDRQGGWFGAAAYRTSDGEHAILSIRHGGAASDASMEAIADAFQLTRSESDVLRCLVDGKCPKTAATELGVSEHTVRAHLRGLYGKMSVRGITHLVRLASTFV